MGEAYSLAEGGAEAGLDGAETFEEEGDAEEVDLVLVDVDVDAGLVDELVVNAEGAREAESDLRRGASCMSVNCRSMECHWDPTYCRRQTRPHSPQHQHRRS